MRALFAKGADSSVLKFLDARTKLAVTLAVAILTVACSGVISQIVIFASSLIYALYLKRPGLLAVLYGLMAVMMAIAALFGLLLEEWLPAMGGITLRALFVPFMRGLSMMNVVMVLAMTTRVEDLLATLERIRLPFCIFLPTAVMLRFIPTFTNDIRQVWETLRIRGWPVGPVMMTCRPLLCARLILGAQVVRNPRSCFRAQGPRHDEAHDAHRRPHDEDDRCAGALFPLRLYRPHGPRGNLPPPHLGRQDHHDALTRRRIRCR